MSYTKSEGTMEINRAPLPPKSGLRFSLRHRESVERVHINRGISTKYPDMHVPFRHFPDVGEKI